MPYTILEPDGSISVAARNPIEAKLALKELKLHKKSFGLEKKQLNEQMRQIRFSYTSGVQRQGSKFRGGGWLGKIVRIGQTASRDDARYNLAATLQPYEERKQWIEATLLRIDEAIITVEFYIHENS